MIHWVGETDAEHQPRLPLPLQINEEHVSWGCSHSCVGCNRTAGHTGHLNTHTSQPEMFPLLYSLKEIYVLRSYIGLKIQGAKQEAIYGPELHFSRILHWLQPVETQLFLEKTFHMWFWSNMNILPHKDSSQCGKKQLPRTSHRWRPGFLKSHLTRSDLTQRFVPEK